LVSGQAVAPVDFSAPPRRRALFRPWYGQQIILPNRSSRWRWCWLMVRCRRCRQTRTRICSTWWSAAMARSASSSI